MSAPGDRPSGRVLVVGWDGAPWGVLQPMMGRGELPVLSRLVAAGSSGVLRSTVPPLSPHAWSSFMTGTNAGKHGVYGFAEPRPGSYGIRFLAGHSLQAEPVWSLLSRHGLRVGVMNVPVTYPPREVNGFLVSGMDTPGGAPRFTHPPELAAELARAAGPGGYEIDFSFVGQVTDANRHRIAARLVEIEEARARAALHLMRTREWDLMVVVFTGPDRLQHFFWHCMDPDHPAHAAAASEPFRDVIPGMFRRLDRMLGELLDAAGPETTTLIMSDHGFGGFVDGIEELNLPDWLLREGYLAARTGAPPGEGRPRPAARAREAGLRGARFARSVLRRVLPSELKRRLRRLMPEAFAAAQSMLYFSGVEWPRTRVYASYDEVLPRGLRVNLKGREPEGVVEPGAGYEALRDELLSKLRALKHPRTGEPLVAGAWRREEVYQGPQLDKAADIVLEWSDRALYPVRAGEPPLPAPSRPPVFPLSDHGRTGDHRQEGVVVIAGSAAASDGGSAAGPGSLSADLVDLAPTLLYLLGQPVPRDMDGRVLLEALRPEVAARHAVRASDEPTVAGGGERGEYDAADEESIREQLRGLGYIQ